MTYKDLTADKTSSTPGTAKPADPKPAEKQQEAMISVVSDSPARPAEAQKTE